MDRLTIPLPICKVCNGTIDIQDGIKEIVNPITGEHEFYHKDCKSEWEKGSDFLKGLKCPYCGYAGGSEYGTNMPFIDNLGVLKMDCAKCTRRFNVGRKQ
jgi:hypothetical protein